MKKKEKISGEVFLQIKVIPNSTKNKIAGKFLDEKGLEYYKINIAAVAEDGKANQELIKFLSKTCKISKSKITILRGENSRIKMVKIVGDVEIDNFH